MAKTTIEYYKIRDFGAKLNITIEFIRQNFKTLMKLILIIAVPAGLLFSLLFSNLFSTMFGFGLNDPDMDENEAIGFLGVLGVNYVLMLVISLIVGALLFGVVYYYMRQVAETDEPVEVRAIFGKALGKVPGLVGLFFIMAILISLGFVVFILPGFYLMIVLLLAIPVYLFEEVSVSEAISRPFKLIRGKWWSTFGLVFIAYMIASASSYIFAIPMYVSMFAGMFSVMDSGEPDPNQLAELYTSWSTVVGMGVLMIGSYLTQLIPVIAIAFQYFNLKERVEGTGLKAQIENFENIG